MLLCSVYKYLSEPLACMSQRDVIFYICIALCYLKFDIAPHIENLQQIQYIFEVAFR